MSQLASIVMQETFLYNYKWVTIYNLNYFLLAKHVQNTQAIYLQQLGSEWYLDLQSEFDSFFEGLNSI